MDYEMTFYGYTKELKPEQLFSLPDSRESGWCCMIWEVSSQLSAKLKKDGIDCPVGDFFVCGDDDLGIADASFKTLDDASTYVFRNFKCKHLYMMPEAFRGCTKCNCSCDDSVKLAA